MQAKQILAACAAALSVGAVATYGVASAHGTNPTRRQPTARAVEDSSTVYEWGQFGGGLREFETGKPSTAAPLGLGPVLRSPQVVRDLPGTVTQVATSNSDDYALTSDGSVYAWGAGAQGELGNGSRAHLSEKPVRVSFPAGVQIVSLSNPMPYNAAMAIAADGTVWAWGDDLPREFCRRHGAILTTPVQVPLADVTLAVGALKHAVYDSKGRIVSCGEGPNGQLGNGTSGAGASSWRPVAVKDLPSLAHFADLTSSWGDAGALTADGRYYDWGYNAGGQVGNGSTTEATTAAEVPLPGPVRTIFQGGGYGNNGQTLAILASGSLWEWGSGASGQMGNRRTADAPSPRRLKAAPRLHFVSVGSGGSTNYAIDRAGQLWAWGNNSVGQLGDGSVKHSERVPVLDPITVSQVSSTAHNVVALGADGS